jgi:hypothetical protein
MKNNKKYLSIAIIAFFLIMPLIAIQAQPTKAYGNLQAWFKIEKQNGSYQGAVTIYDLTRGFHADGNDKVSLLYYTGDTLRFEYSAKGDWKLKNMTSSLFENEVYYTSTVDIASVTSAINMTAYYESTVLPQYQAEFTSSGVTNNNCYIEDTTNNNIAYMTNGYASMQFNEGDNLNFIAFNTQTREIDYLAYNLVINIGNLSLVNVNEPVHVYIHYKSQTTTVTPNPSVTTTPTPNPNGLDLNNLLSPDILALIIICAVIAVLGVISFKIINKTEEITK